MALGSKSGMGFLRTNDLQLAQKGEFQFGFWGFVKIVRFGRLQTENKLKKNMKKNSLKHWATSLRSYGD